jgi:hypothetical protein
MEMSWDERSSTGKIWFRSDNIEDSFSMNLIPRSGTGFTSGTESTGITTRSGYYQPAGFRDYEGTRSIVFVDHGTMDFPSSKDMQLTLGKGGWSRDSVRALSRDGILVICDIEEQDWNFEVFRLTMRGLPIRDELLRPYLHGNVRVEQGIAPNDR